MPPGPGHRTLPPSGPTSVTGEARGSITASRKSEEEHLELTTGQRMHPGI